MRQEGRGAVNSIWGKVIWNNNIDNKNLVMTSLEEPPPQSHHPAKFSGQKSCESGDMNFSNCHMIKGSCDFKGRSLSKSATCIIWCP